MWWWWGAVLGRHRGDGSGAARPHGVPLGSSRAHQTLRGAIPPKLIEEFEIPDSLLVAKIKSAE